MGLGIAWFAASGLRISGRRAEIVAEGGLAPTALAGSSRALGGPPGRATGLSALRGGGLGVHLVAGAGQPWGSAGEQGQALEIMLGKAF